MRAHHRALRARSRTRTGRHAGTAMQLRSASFAVVLTTDRPDPYMRAEAERYGAILLAMPFRLDAPRLLVGATIARADRRAIAYGRDR
jgi:hypothetical protein